jgi:hypothetical protein
MGKCGEGVTNRPEHIRDFVVKAYILRPSRKEISSIGRPINEIDKEPDKE